MKFECTHPADALATIMERIYTGGMTTTSGGNLSVRDSEGDIWITPAGIDKGALTANDMVRMRGGEKLGGLHRPSSELPFHMAVYEARPDVSAVLHAHPPALVAFSLARKLPKLSRAALARYALPGSDALGVIIGDELKKGYDIVLMENHGAVVAAADIFEAYKRFETSELFAAIEINTAKLGGSTAFEKRLGSTLKIEFAPKQRSAEECALRRDMTAFIRRAVRQKLFFAEHGSFSSRLSGGFVITPHGKDRAYLREPDLVSVQGGNREAGKDPSLSARLHDRIYQEHPDINAIIGARPPYAMAFALTGAEFDTVTIPESYIMLREVKRAPLGIGDGEISSLLSKSTPALIIDGDQILVTGATPLQAFDRLEVFEATARSIIASRSIGEIIRITGSEVKDIDRAFNLEYN